MPLYEGGYPIKTIVLKDNCGLGCEGTANQEVSLECAHKILKSLIATEFQAFMKLNLIAQSRG